MRIKTFSCLVGRSLLLGWTAISLQTGCALRPSSRALLPGNRALIACAPHQATGDQVKLAVKDNINVKGFVTTAGSQHLATKRPPAETDAACLAIARQRRVHIVGKANLSEFAAAPSGINDYFGTPPSPLSTSDELLPGGSSCGSAVAVASGMADVAFGTDTAGSIRVPAAWCGIVGLKTTHGLVPIEGVLPIEPDHLDTVGPMGKDIAHTVKGMDLLQNGFAALYAAAMADKPSAKAIRIGRLHLKGTDRTIDEAVDAALARTGFQVIPLDDAFRDAWDQAKDDGNSIAASGVWLSYKNFRGKRGVSARTKTAIRAGGVAYRTTYRAAVERQGEWQKRLDDIFTRVDFIALPTLQVPPIALPPDLGLGIKEARMLALQNTVPVNYAGNPALALPIPLHGDKVALTSLQLVGPRLSEAQLLNAGRLVEAAIEKQTDGPQRAQKSPSGALPNLQ